MELTRKRRARRVRRITLCLMVTMLLGIVGSSYAFYSSENSRRNTLATSESAVYLQEIFKAEDHWLPGETKEKIVTFGNQGTAEQVIRFKYQESWLDASGRAFTPDTGDYTEALVKLNWSEDMVDAGGDWVYLNGWYYYNKILKPGTVTNDVLKSVTFSPQLSNDGHLKDDFSNTSFRLVVTMESMNVNAVETVANWSASFTVTDPGAGKLQWSQ